MSRIHAVPLDADAFAPFGDVISAGATGGSSANQGTAVRFDWATTLVNDRPGARPNVAVFRAAAGALPFRVRLLERHPRSTQMFVPMTCASCLVVVAPRRNDGTPHLRGLRAFRGGPGQAINYAKGVWHHPILALEAPADLLMLAWEDGGAEDCVEHPIDDEITIV
jgi:ureidoglycolate lyase